MASSETVVARVLKLPPDEQPFFKFRDLLNEILNRLDHFYLAIVSAEDKNPFPEALQLLQETRANAAAQASLAYRLVFTAIQFAREYLGVLGEMVGENPGQSDLFGELAYVAYYAGIMIKEYGQAEKEMAKFGQETVAAVKKIPQMLNDSQGGESKKREFLTAENTQVVSDLLRVISAYATVIRECLGYYKQMEKHLTDLKEAGGPYEISEQEAQLVRERWSGFITSCARLLPTVSEISHLLKLPGPLLNLASHSSQGPSSTSNNAPPADAVLAITASSSPSAKPRKRTLLRCLISCFSLKYFAKD